MDVVLDVEVLEVELVDDVVDDVDDDVVDDDVDEDVDDDVDVDGSVVVVSQVLCEKTRLPAATLSWVVAMSVSPAGVVTQ